MSRVVGFTGTRVGMKSAQVEKLREVLAGVTRLHHGDCVGADAEACAIAKELGALTAGHPPINPSLRAWTTNDRDHPPVHYLVRNRRIVDATNELVACPGKLEESRRSGTWATIRHARAIGRPITIIWPTGDTKHEPAAISQGDA